MITENNYSSLYVELNTKKSNGKFRENVFNTNESLLQTLKYCYALLNKQKKLTEKE